MIIYANDSCQSLKIKLKFTVNRTMGILKYLLALWTTIAVYTIFSLLGGPKGISAYNHLLSEQALQRANLRELGIINEELERTRDSFLHDHDTLLVHARQMGYGNADERFVRIVGLGKIQSTPAVTGLVYIAQKQEFISDKIFKIAALTAGLLVFAFLFMLEAIDKRVR
jgi:hypothetical protein